MHDKIDSDIRQSNSQASRGIMDDYSAADLAAFVVGSACARDQSTLVFASGTLNIMLTVHANKGVRQLQANQGGEDLLWITFLETAALTNILPIVEKALTQGSVKILQEYLKGDGMTVWNTSLQYDPSCFISKVANNRASHQLRHANLLDSSDFNTQLASLPFMSQDDALTFLTRTTAEQTKQEQVLVSNRLYR